MLPQIMREFDWSVAMASAPSAVFAVISSIGMILVICAVVAGRRKLQSPQQSYRPGGAPQGPPMQQQAPGYPPAHGQQPGPYQTGPQ